MTSLGTYWALLVKGCIHGWIGVGPLSGVFWNLSDFVHGYMVFYGVVGCLVAKIISSWVGNLNAFL